MSLATSEHQVISRQMKCLKLLAVLLGAKAFLPVSCSTGVLLGTKLIAQLDERSVAEGEAVHPLFSIVIISEEQGVPFRVIRLADLEQGNEHPKTFLLTKPEGHADFQGSSFTYHVLQDTGQEQVIELVERYNDGDNTIWSRYKASETSVQPLSSKMFYFGYMFMAFPLALAFALLLYAIGRMLRRNIDKANDD